MACFAGGRIIEVKGHGQIRERREWIVERVGDEFCAGRDDDVGLAGELQGPIGGGIDGRR